jgi:hypothetical protein
MSTLPFAFTKFGDFVKYIEGFISCTRKTVFCGVIYRLNVASRSLLEVGGRVVNGLFLNLQYSPEIHEIRRVEKRVI